MKSFAITLTFLLVFPTQTLARSFQDSASSADKCDSLARACTGAARELAQARRLIEAAEQDIVAKDERIRIARQEIENLKKAGELHTSRALELENVIAAEEKAKVILLKRVELQEDRIRSLEKRLGRVRKVAAFLGVAAAVGILIAVAK